MNDNDIIKALENCKNNGDCKDCILNPHVGNYGYCTSIAIEAALDIINRQKAEIERLEKELNTLTKQCYKSGIKEFAERIHSEIKEARNSNFNAISERVKKTQHGQI